MIVAATLTACGTASASWIWLPREQVTHATSPDEGAATQEGVVGHTSGVLWHQAVRVWDSAGANRAVGYYMQVGPQWDPAAAWQDREVVTDTSLGYRTTDVSLVADDAEDVYVAAEIFNWTAPGLDDPDQPRIGFRHRTAQGWGGVHIISPDSVRWGANSPNLTIQHTPTGDTVHVVCRRRPAAADPGVWHTRWATTDPTDAAWEPGTHVTATLGGLRAGSVTVQVDSTGKVHFFGRQVVRSTPADYDTVRIWHFRGYPPESGAWSCDSLVVAQYVVPATAGPPESESEGASDDEASTQNVDANGGVFRWVYAVDGTAYYTVGDLAGTWTSPVPLTATGDSVDGPTITRAANGDLHVTYLSPTAPGLSDPPEVVRIYHMLSTDDGASWSRPTEITAEQRTFSAGCRILATANGVSALVTTHDDDDSADADWEVWSHEGHAIPDTLSTTNETWSGTVYLDDDFEVQAGKTLTIEPGTKVFAAASSGSDKVELIVHGQLTAEGTTNDPILFTSYGGSGGEGEWGGIRVDLAGSLCSAYGYVASVQPLSSIKHARIDAANVGVRIVDLVAPSLEDVLFTNITKVNSVAQHILLDSTDVAIPHGAIGASSCETTGRGWWVLEAPTNVVATNGVRAGHNHPASFGDATKVDLFVDGLLKTNNVIPPVDYVAFIPQARNDTTGAEWGGLEVHYCAAGSQLRYAEVSHAAEPLYFVYPESTFVEYSAIHHYATYGIRVTGGGSAGSGGLTVTNSMILRGAGLGSTKGIWGVHAENSHALRLLNNRIYDYDHRGGTTWTQSRVGGGGGIRILNSLQFCGATAPEADSVVVRGNSLVGPGEAYPTYTRIGMDMTWACGTSNREVVVEKNAVVQWNEGLKMLDSRDVFVSCNRIKDNTWALDWYRSDSRTSDPEVRLKENLIASSDQRSVFVDEGMEKCALGPRTATGSTADRGLNKVTLADGDDFYVSQFDSNFVAASDSLWSNRNQWNDGAIETSEAAVIAQCEPVTGSNRNQIDADGLITSSYSITCVPASDPSLTAPEVRPTQGGMEMVAAGGPQSAPGDDFGRDPSAVGSAAVVVVPTGIRDITPNPAKGGVSIRFGLGGAERGQVKITVFGVTGRRVRNVVDGPLAPGLHAVSWDGRDSADRPVAAGVYFVRFEANGVQETRKIVQVR